MRIKLFIALAACLFAAPSTFAQTALKAKADAAPAVRSNTEKLFLQAHFNGTGLSVDGSDAESGNGFGIKIGYGFSPLFTLYAGLDGASMDGIGGVDYGYGLFDIGGQFNFRSGANALVPYLDVALTGQAAVFDEAGEEVTFSGAGFTFGGGLKYFLSPVLALDGSLTATVGSFTTVEYDGVSVSDEDGLDSSGARFSLGISWYPVR